MGGVWVEGIWFVKICESIPVFEHQDPVWRLAREGIAHEILNLFKYSFTMVILLPTLDYIS